MGQDVHERDRGRAHALVVAVEKLRALLLLLARLPVLVRRRLAALVALLPLLLEPVGLEPTPPLLPLRRPAVYQMEVVLLRRSPPPQACSPPCLAVLD